MSSEAVERWILRRLYSGVRLVVAFATLEAVVLPSLDEIDAR